MREMEKNTAKFGRYGGLASINSKLKFLPNDRESRKLTNELGQSTKAEIGD